MNTDDAGHRCLRIAYRNEDCIGGARGELAEPVGDHWRWRAIAELRETERDLCRVV